MAKFGRNKACPCRSGVKYKRCCLDLHQRGQRATAEVQRAAVASGDPSGYVGQHLVRFGAATRVARDFLAAGDLDQALEAATELLERFPGEVDGLELLAAVHEARGDTGQALRHHHMTVAYIEAMGNYAPDAALEPLAAIRRLQG